MNGPRTGDDPVALWASARVTELLDGQDVTARLPKYGSTAWRQLAGDDPRRYAATITAAELWRRFGDEDELLAWFREAHHARPALASRKTLAELNQAAKPKPAHQLRAAPGWPPVAIPGRPGWSRHLVNGEQVDLPHNNRSGAAAA